ncbi:MAG: hypothetical protein Q9178_007531 [Gyalolechia marmorata]
MVYKRFGIVFSRLLLNKLDEIRHMEDELQAIDKTDDACGGGPYLMSRDEDVKRDPKSIPWLQTGLQTEPQTRPQLLEKLESKILEYSELLLKANQIRALEKPSARDYLSVLHYMENDGGQTYENEMSWIYDKEDLVSLRPGGEHGWLDGMLEGLLRVCPGRIVRETDARTDNPAIRYYDRRRISKCVTFLTTILILALLMIPIGLLYRLSVNGTSGTKLDAIVIILSFTMVLSAALAVLTKAKRHEIMAASAG